MYGGDDQLVKKIKALTCFCNLWDMILDRCRCVPLQCTHAGSPYLRAAERPPN
jgi:hypothetical protein